MSMEKILNIAGSAMSAQSVRLNTTASNLANANSVGSTPEEAYRARQPVFRAVMDNASAFSIKDQANVGVSVVGIVESGADVQRRFEPDNPLANEQGYVYQSNVNTVEEMANMISASRDYQTNVEVANMTKRLMLETINLLQGR
jgi:flagellar basal-body rod protein FlgC